MPTICTVYSMRASRASGLCGNWGQAEMCDFMVVIYWVARKVIEDEPKGLVWGLTARLKIATLPVILLSFHIHEKDVQDKTSRND